MRIRLSDSTHFVEIREESKRYYGGDQAWFEGKARINGGCGTVAAANITAYMARHMDEIYQYVRPIQIPFTEIPLGGCSVAMLIGYNKRWDHTRIQQPNGYAWTQQSMKLHWVVITELEVDQADHSVRVKVSTWGGYCYLNLDDYIERNLIYECLLYVV